MLCLGGAGHLSCVANFAPEPVAGLYNAFVAGDHARARELHYDLHPLVDAAFAEVNPVPAKWALKRLGLLAFDRVIAVDLRCTFLGMMHRIGTMLRNDLPHRGTIVNTPSDAGLMAVTML